MAKLPILCSLLNHANLPPSSFLSSTPHHVESLESFNLAYWLQWFLAYNGDVVFEDFVQNFDVTCIASVPCFGVIQENDQSCLRASWILTPRSPGPINFTEKTCLAYFGKSAHLGLYVLKSLRLSIYDIRTLQVSQRCFTNKNVNHFTNLFIARRAENKHLFWCNNDARCFQKTDWLMLPKSPSSRALSPVRPFKI